MFWDKNWLEPPKVFISSTVHDRTGAYRIEIAAELEKMGMHIVEFKDNKFPYGYDNTTDIIKETIEAVHTADVFLLIIGKKYGQILDDGKSVVHHEYEEAVKNNMATFVFVEKKVWDDYDKNLIGGKHNVENESHKNFIKQVSVNKIRNFSNVGDCIEHIKKQFNNHLGSLFRFSRWSTWLWGGHRTKEFESNAKELWIITPDFYWDFTDKDFKDIVVKNVKRGCVYRYIYLDNDRNKRRVKEMIRSYKLLFRENGIDEEMVSKTTYFLPIQDADFVWSCEQILFNPFGLKEAAIMVDIMEGKEKSPKYNIAYGSEKRLNFRRQFMFFWNKHTVKEEDKIDESKYYQ
jgi:hypothetical protein